MCEMVCRSGTVWNIASVSGYVVRLVIANRKRNATRNLLLWDGRNYATSQTAAPRIGGSGALKLARQICDIGKQRFARIIWHIFVPGLGYGTVLENKSGNGHIEQRVCGRSRASGGKYGLSASKAALDDVHKQLQWCAWSNKMLTSSWHGGHNTNGSTPSLDQAPPWLNVWLERDWIFDWLKRDWIQRSGLLKNLLS